MARSIRCSPWVPVVAGLVTVVALLCPWAASGSVDRSSIELIGSATALDLLTGWQRVVLLGGWMAVVTLVAAAVVAVAWDRPAVGAALLVPVGPVMAVAWWVVADSALRWRFGAPMGTVSGLTATVTGCLVLLDHRTAR